MEEVKNWFEEGNEWFWKRDFLKALYCYEKEIESGSNKMLLAYFHKGIVLGELGKYEQAIEYFDNVIKVNPSIASLYYNKGVSLYGLNKYQQAIECFDKAIDLEPDDIGAYHNKGCALSNLGKYQQAIKCYNKVIDLKPDDARVYNNKGVTLCGLGEYQQAIKCYDKAIELYPNFASAQKNRRILSRALLLKDNDLLKILRDIYSVYDSDFYDNVTIGLSEDDKHCNTIYFLSLKILNELRIKETDKHETNVAHYTSKKVSQILFFDKDEEEKPIPFRLNSVTNSNDTQEGRTLFNYLFDNQKICPQSEHFVAFVGCFMFNFDNLNQFRLYGRDEEEKEGTGVSIVMKSDFFSLVGKSPIQQEDRKVSQDDIKEPLFRCIYIDPETNQVVSIGHRDFHTFYKTKDILYNRENKNHIEEIAKEIRAYQDEIVEKTKAVKGYLEELKNAIDEARKQGLNDKVICDLLLNLRYLVKHVAFKEEQECRIVKIKRPLDSEPEAERPKNENHERFFVNYLPLKNCVKKIYFGPKATGMELFQSLLTYQEGFKGVICYRSTSPLA